MSSTLLEEVPPPRLTPVGGVKEGLQRRWARPGGRAYAVLRWTGATVFIKGENFQRMGAFKFRGAYNRLAQLSAAERERGVVAFSSGNHAQGVALAAQDRGGAPARFAMTAGLLVLTVALGAGIFTVTLGVWLPAIKKAYDNRKSISETLSATIASSGVDQAVKQYHDFRTAESSAYDFDEGELNALGYQLIRAKKFKESIRILQLNVEAYPQSSNTYDSLGEAYLDDGNQAQAIANYQKSLQLNPKNRNAILVLQKLNAP